MGLIAVTGAAGFLGEKLVETLIGQGHTVNAISRNEGKLTDLKQKYRDVNIFPCPIEDYALLRKATQKCDGIFHLAAFKSVSLAQENPTKVVQTNIIGSMNLLNIVLESPNIKFIASASTDKAAKPHNVYSATKFIVEKLFLEHEQINPACKYRVIRCGNIMYSTGSVLVYWKKALEEGREIVITNPDATRFFWTREDAIDLLFDSLENATDASPYLPTMKSIRMGDLLEVMASKYAKAHPVKIKTIGLQPGENMHEQIDLAQISNFAPKWEAADLYDLV